MKKSSDAERFERKTEYALMGSWVLIVVLLLGALVLDLLGVKA